MTLTEVAPGIRSWSTAHPRWRPGRGRPREVNSFLVELDDGIVFVDPLAPAAAEELLVEAASHCAEPPRIVLTAPWHQRSTLALVERTGARVWAPAPAWKRLGFDCERCPLPRGIEAIPVPPVEEGQVALWIELAQALIVAEVFMGVDEGLVLCPSPALEEPAGLRVFTDAVATLPVERVLPGHGSCVLRGGARHIAVATVQT